jgi:hypothetical protein
MDIYTYLFKKNIRKTKIIFEDYIFYIKLYQDENNILYEIFDWGRVEIDNKDFSSEIKIFEREYNEKEFYIFLKLIDIINRYNYINYSILLDTLTFHNVDFMTVNTLSGFKNPYLESGYKVLQKKFPATKNLDILKSNSYYYHNFFNEYVDSIINLKLKEFIKFLKKIYKDKFYKLAYLKDIIELEKFDYTLKNFILEKANLDRKKCFDFFYSNMGKIMEDLHLLPKKYIMFY